jgi:hypothetical protein
VVLCSLAEPSPRSINDTQLFSDVPAPLWRASFSLFEKLVGERGGGLFLQVGEFHTSPAMNVAASGLCQSNGPDSLGGVF